MRVFLSWSGTLSRQIATALRDWLPNVIQAIDPWMSSEDIDKGARWSAEVANGLQATKAGIVCVTSENQAASWLNFEAGALSKVVDESMVCPYLFHMKPSDLKGPLVQFQAAEANREDTLKLLRTLNSGLGEKSLSETKLDKTFDVWWGQLAEQLAKIPTSAAGKGVMRSPEDMIEEVLSLTREQARATQELKAFLYEVEAERAARERQRTRWASYKTLNGEPAQVATGFDPKFSAFNTKKTSWVLKKVKLAEPQSDPESSGFEVERAVEGTARDFVPPPDKKE